MMNIMEINGYRAVVQYDPDINMFRGEYVGLNGGADFYAKDIDSLRKEGENLSALGPEARNIQRLGLGWRIFLDESVHVH